MKKFIGLFVVSICFVILGGCSHPEDAEKSAKALVDSYIYQQSSPELKPAFGLDDQAIAKENQNTFVTSIQKQFKNVKEADIENLYKKAQKHLEKTTSYQVKVKNSDKKSANIEIAVKGLDIDSEKVKKKVDDIVRNASNQVTADTTDEQIEKIINDASLKAVESIYLDSPAKTKVTKVTLKLKQDPKDKEKWTIENEDQFFKKLYLAFGL